MNHTRVARRRKFKALLSIDGKTICHYCRAVIDAKDATVDHVIPTSKGGADRWWNYRIACGPCNVAKGDGPLCEDVSIEST